MEDSSTKRESATVVITVSGLRGDLLGAFGCDNARTPNVDDLAARSIVLDRLFADSTDTVKQLQSMWTGAHAMQRWKTEAAESSDSLFSRLRGTHCDAAFISDCLQAAELAEQAGCDDSRYCGTPDAPHQVASEPMRCALTAPLLHGANLLAEDGHLPDLIWLHCDGLRMPWDAPLELRAEFCDPEDPAPPADVRYPDIEVDAGTDPDLLVGWSQVAAAQVAAFDEGLGFLMDTIEALESANGTSINLVLLGLGGVPLGEHGHIGGDDWGLHETTLACPAILRIRSHQLPVGVRRHEILQLPDLGATLVELFGFDANGKWGKSCLSDAAQLSLTAPPHPLDRAIVRERKPNGHASYVESTWLRTPAWSLHAEREVHEQSGAPIQGFPEVKAFVMPDDRWECSDVARRSIGVVDQLIEEQERLLQAIHDQSRDSLTELDDALTNLMR